MVEELLILLFRITLRWGIKPNLITRTPEQTREGKGKGKGEEDGEEKRNVLELQPMRDRGAAIGLTVQYT